MLVSAAVDLPGPNIDIAFVLSLMTSIGIHANGSSQANEVDVRQSFMDDLILTKIACFAAGMGSAASNNVTWSLVPMAAN